MFLKDELEILMDKRRDKELREVAKVIKRCIIGYLARKRFLEKRAAIMLIQKVYRVWNYICIGKNSCRLNEKIASNEGLKFNQCSKDFFAVFRKLLLKDWSAYIAG
jgi:myosin heavy subunit